MVTFLKRMINGIKSRLSNDGCGPIYSIFTSIPHQRVTSKNVHAAEIIDLYQLGLFTVSDSPLKELMDTLHAKDKIQENLELVELQPESEYKPHYHKHSAAIIYIVSGTGTFRLGDVTSEYMPGKRISIPAGLLHGFNTKTRTLFLSIQSPPILNPDTQEVDLHYENSISNKRN